MAYVTRRGMMMLRIERNQDLCIAGTNGSVGAVGPINTGVGQANVVENGLQFLLRDLLAQHSFDFIAEPCCFFYTQAGPSAHMQTKLASINLREEVLA